MLIKLKLAYSKLKLAYSNLNNRLEKATKPFNLKLKYPNYFTNWVLKSG